MKYLSILLFFSFLSSYGQVTITGQVLDMKTNPISLATIDLVGKSTPTTTDDLGVFYLKLPSEAKKGDIITLRISKNGYKTATKQIAVSPLSIPIRLVRDRVLTPPVAKSSAQVATKPEENTPIERKPSITSYFQSGGITANQVNIGSVPRTLDAYGKNSLLTNIPNKDEKIYVSSVGGDSESFQFAQEITDFLKANGYKNVNGVIQSFYTTPVFGQTASRDSTGLNIIIGIKK